MVDAMKGFCILMVIFTHLGNRSEEIRSFFFYQFMVPFMVLPAVSIFMILTSYVFSKAEDHWNSKRGGNWSIIDWFEKDRFYPRFLRFFIPYAVIMIIEMIMIRLILNPKCSMLSFSFITRFFFSGGRGPGAYYILVILEFLLVFPFLKYWYKRDPFKAVGGMILIHLGFDTASRYLWNLSEVVYDRMIFRFFVNIAMGLLLAEYAQVFKKTAIPVACVIVGAIYRINISYLGYSQVIMPTRFVSNSIINNLYAFGVVALLLPHEGLAKRYVKALTPLCLCGKASLHIFLVQKVYFYIVRSLEFEKKLGNFGVTLLVDYVICLLLGFLYYFLDAKIRELVKNVKKPKISIPAGK